MKKSLNYVDFDLAYNLGLKLCEEIKRKDSENIAILDSLGRVLSKDVVCIKNLPSFNNSAMDGYAIKLEDLKKSLKIDDTIFAGDKKEFKEPKNGHCYKIMTGAKVPSFVDIVIPYELCEVSKDEVRFTKELKKGSNIRLKGEEHKIGEVLLKKGEKIDSSLISLLVSQGVKKIEVYKKLNIAIISSGNELKEPWEEANEDEIYNINSFFIKSLLDENNFVSTYLGVVPDSLEKSIEFIKKLENYDVIITSGGISMGDADFLAKAFTDCGLEVLFHGVNLKPGRAMMLGKLNNSLVLALPGNPLANAINSHIFLLPILKKLQGESRFNHDFIECKNSRDFKVKEDRVEAVLGFVEHGIFQATKDNKYGSAMIGLLSNSNAIALSSGKNNTIKESEILKILPFAKKYIENRVDFLN